MALIDSRPTSGAIDPPLISDPARRWAVMFGIWTATTVFFITQSVVRRLVFDLPMEWKEMIFYEAIYWYAYFLLTPIILWYARRRPIRPEQRVQDILRHSALAVLIGASHSMLHFLAAIP